MRRACPTCPRDTEPSTTVRVPALAPSAAASSSSPDVFHLFSLDLQANRFKQGYFLSVVLLWYIETVELNLYLTWHNGRNT